jgi:pimeloyl-ACP methyl ester carboxylesterase
MGGQIAMELARRYAHRLRGLVLAATFPRVDTPQVQRYRCDLADRLDSGGKSATELADELLPKMLSATSIQLLPDVAAFVHAMMRRAPARGAAAALRGRAERPAYESTLASFAMPSLILVGDSDAFTTRDDAEQMHELLRHSRLVRWPGVGHMPNLELPQAFNGELVSFLETLA